MPDEAVLPEELVELQPLDPDLVSADEALEASEAAVGAEDDASVVVAQPPAPVGQTLAMDFEMHSVITGGQAPKLVRREMALRQWIEKCLRTHRGAHPIHPEGYGMNEPISELIGLVGGQVQTGELEDEVRDALLFNPTISDIVNFTAVVTEPDPVNGDASVELSFTVLTEDGSALPVTTQLSGQVTI